jgi:CheY-specific phosphatase CheX
MLAAATSEVLETMFFTGVDGPARAGGSAGVPRLAARLGFEGTPSGVLTLSVSEPVMRALAANFLAAEEGETLSAGQLGSVVCELANMICGSLLSRVKTEEHFRLSSPELIPEGAPGPAEPPSQSLVVSDGVGEGVVDLWLALECRAN